MKMPRISEIVRKFKDLCRHHGWRTSESEDWVEINDEYHNFLYARDIHPSSFRRIATNRKCVVREGLSYHVVEASYTAWLFSETPSKVLLETVFENPDFSKRIALYDLSPMLGGKRQCVKLNYTDSPIFQEFESFLKNEFKINLRPLLNPRSDAKNFTLAELA